jgi:citrate synthase
MATTERPTVEAWRSAMFIIGRTAGLATHVTEEYTRERAMRIKVPFIYDGPVPAGD